MGIEHAFCLHLKTVQAPDLRARIGYEQISEHTFNLKVLSLKIIEMKPNAAYYKNNHLIEYYIFTEYYSGYVS